MRKAFLVLFVGFRLFSQPADIGDPPAQNPVFTVPKSGPVAAARETPAVAGDWYDTSDRQAVRNAFYDSYLPTSDIDYGYVGNPAAGVAGSTSAAYKTFVLQRVNYFRAMAGVSPVLGIDPVLSGKSQEGALMLYANGSLSHTPPTTWLRYTPQGAEALAAGNLCQGRQNDTACIVAYMDDFGANNTVVGHRRWILDPRVQRIGTGDIPVGSNQLWNVLYVNEPETISRPRPFTREEFVSWPPKGYVPYQLAFNRWSFHWPNGDFTEANISMTRNGLPVPIRIESRSEALPSYIYLPEPSIVWIPDNLPVSPTVPVKPLSDTLYHVKITGVQVNGMERDFEYDVIVFDPETAGSGPTPLPNTPGSPAVVSFYPLDGAGYSGSFTATFRQSSGKHYLGYMLFLPTPNIVQYTATGSCLIEYNSYSHGIRLIDNAGTGWLGPLEGVPIRPGAGMLTNNQCRLDVSTVRASVSGITMTVTAEVTFFHPLGPVLGTFLQALDSNGVWTGMTQFGNWRLPNVAQNRLGPSVTSVNTTSTIGRQATYTIVSSHTAGSGALTMVNLLVSASIVGSPACHIVYFPGDNTLNLVNDAATGLVSEVGVPVGQMGLLSNSRCSVPTGSVTRSNSVNTITLVVPVTYAPAFVGPKFVYLNVFDNAGWLSHWVTGSTMLVE